MRQSVELVGRSVERDGETCGRVLLLEGAHTLVRGADDLRLLCGGVDRNPECKTVTLEQMLDMHEILDLRAA
nr:hypothetical protein [Breoghania sp.]